MTTSVQKWGNSLGIRVPKAIADQLKLEQGSQIEFEARNGVLTIRPLRHPHRRRGKYKLADLLKRYKGPYPHKGVFNDPPVGKELI